MECANTARPNLHYAPSIVPNINSRLTDHDHRVIARWLARMDTSPCYPTLLEEIDPTLCTTNPQEHRKIASIAFFIIREALPEVPVERADSTILSLTMATAIRVYLEFLNTPAGQQGANALLACHEHLRDCFVDALAGACVDFMPHQARRVLLDFVNESKAHPVDYMNCFSAILHRQPQTPVIH